MTASTYDPAARLRTRALGLLDTKLVEVTTTYDYYDWDDLQMGRLQGISTPGWQDLRYDYDLAGNVSSIEDWAAEPVEAQTQNFGYDALNRLTSASVSGGGEGAYTEAYEYYRGCRLARKGQPGNPSDGSYAYADSDHLHAATAYKDHRYCYDANGNATTRLAAGQLCTLTYNPENRLASVQRVDNAPASIMLAGANVQLTWPPVAGASEYEVWRSTSPYFSPGDSASEKIAEQTGTSFVDAGKIGDVRTNWYYQILATDGSCPVGVSQRLGEFDFGLVAGSGAPAASRPLSFALPEVGPLAPVVLSSTTIAEYTYDGDGNRVKAVVNGETTHYPGRHFESTLGSGHTKYYFAGGQLIAFERSPEYETNYGRRYVFRDHLGSTSVIANGGGTKLWEDRFKAFGDTRFTYCKNNDPNFPMQTGYRYTGQRHEPDIGLYDYRSRFYDPVLGRFTQPDTIVPEPGNPQSLNRYLYVNNRPTVFNDPTGHYIFEDNPNDVYTVVPPNRNATGQSVGIIHHDDIAITDPVTTAEFLAVVTLPYQMATVATLGGTLLVEGGGYLIFEVAVPATQAGWVKLAEALGIACAMAIVGTKLNS